MIYMKLLIQALQMETWWLGRKETLGITYLCLEQSEEPIQLQVLDVEKCFDKLLLQSTTNALFEAGVQSEQ